MAIATAETMKAIREYADPALQVLEENVRGARRKMVAGRHAVEDYAAEAGLQVRRHPFTAVATAVGVGALLGCVIGFTVGRRKTPSK